MIHKMAIVGYGVMGGWHSEILKKIEGLELAGIWDIKEERRDYAELKEIPVYGGLEELLADQETDLVLIATPNDFHKSIAIAAMKAGKNVVSEKPITLSSSDLQDMIDVSEETGMFLTVHQNRRWDQDFLTIKKIVKEKTLGEIFRIESRVHGSRGIPGDWRQDKAQGGGMVLDWGVHLLDQILQLYQGTQLKTVYATLTNVTNQMVDDGFTADLGFADGAHVLVEVGTSNYVSLPRWYVLGTEGSAIIEGWDMKGKIVRTNGVNEKNVVPVATAAGLTKTMAPRKEDNIVTEELPEVTSDIRGFYQNVMAVLEKREDSLIKLPEAMQVMHLMEAIFRSSEEKSVVAFDQV